MAEEGFELTQQEQEEVKKTTDSLNLPERRRPTSLDEVSEEKLTQTKSFIERMINSSDVPTRTDIFKDEFLDWDQFLLEFMYQQENTERELRPLLESGHVKTEDLFPTILQRSEDILTLRKQVQEMEDLGFLDELTGLHNQAFKNVVLPRKIEEAQEKKKKMSFFAIDVDNLKGVNDNLGHSGGDLLLKEVANVLELGLRAGDILMRFGGDEFGVFLIDLSQEEAQDIAERLRQLAEERLIKIVPEEERENIVKPTFSIGVSYYDPNVENKSVDQLLHEADVAVYNSKYDGTKEKPRENPIKNKVTLFHQDLEIPQGKVTSR